MPYTPGSYDGDGWDEPTLPAPRRAPLGVYGPDAPTQVKSRRSPPLAPRGDFPPQPPRRAATRTRAIRRGPGRRVIAGVILLLLAAIVVALIPITRRTLAFGAAISSQPPLSTQTGLMSGAGRVNVLVMGYGGAGWDGPYLTDSMMVLSFVPGDHATTLISVPRDLWVQIPPNSGNYAKLNDAFEQAYYNGYDSSGGKLPPGQLAGGAQATTKVSEITGLDIPYFMTIDFQGFRQLIDAIGGIDVNVPRTIVLNYPPGHGWPKQFTKGMQHMNGLQALQYARARYVLSPAIEGTDFGRAARQQLLIRAIIERLRSPSAWHDLPAAMDALQKTLYSNLSLADLSALFLKFDLNHAARIGLTTSNVLVNAVSNDGQDILLPQNGDWSAIPKYIDANLKQ